MKCIIRSAAARLECVVFFCIFSLITGCGSEFEILLHKAPRQSVIYWSEASKEISRINPDGTGRKIIFTSSNIPLDIAVDSSNDRIFWTEYTGSAYRINRAGIDGNGSTVVYTTTSDFGPSAISIDDSRGIIYWNEYQISGLGNNIWYSDIYSGALSKIKLLSNFANYYTYSFCVDPAGEKIYCTANSYYSIGSPVVFEVGTNNSGDVYIGHTETTNSASQVTSLNGPSIPSSPFKGIAVDSDGGHVYYVNNTSHGTWPKNITRTDLNLQNPEVWVYQGVADIQKIAIDFQHRKIYWTSESDKRIYRADLDSTNSNVEKFIDLESTPTGIAISQ